MAEKNTVAMFVKGEDGHRIQVGWASPKDGSGVRTFEYSSGYEETRPKDVSFEDDDVNFEAIDEDETEVELEDETEVVELDNGGHILEVEEDDEAEFNRLLAEEQGTETTEEQPQTRRELRDNEDTTND